MQGLLTKLVLAAVLIGSPLAAQEQPEVLTVDQAVQIALADNRTLKIVSLNLDVHNEKLAADKTKRLPSFNTYVFGSELLTPISYTVPAFVNQVQTVLTASLPGVRADFRQLQTNPVNYPVEIRIASQADVSTAASAEDIRKLRSLARQVEDILNSSDAARRVRNEWQNESSQVTLKIDPDRANLAGITNYDVANSATGALSGVPVTALQEGDKNIPVVARLRGDERAQLSDIQNLYVYSSQTSTKIPLVQISLIQNSLENERIVRIDHFRSISVFAFPAPGRLASEILATALPKLREMQSKLPPG